MNGSALESLAPTEWFNERKEAKVSMLSIPIRMDPGEAAAKPRLPRDFSEFFYRTVREARNCDVANDGRRAEGVAKPADRGGERLQEEEAQREASVEAKAEREGKKEDGGDEEQPKVILECDCYKHVIPRS